MKKRQSVSKIAKAAVQEVKDNAKDIMNTPIVEKAKEKALEYDNQELTQMHLLAGLLEIDDSLIAKIFEKMGVNVTGAVNAVEDKLARLPKVSGGNMYAGNNFSKALIQAEKEAKQMGDTYVSVEHLFLGMVDKADSEI